MTSPAHLPSRRRPLHRLPRLFALWSLVVAGLAASGCGPTANASADARLQGPVVPTRALPSPTATTTLTPAATITPSLTPTLTPTATATVAAGPTATLPPTLEVTPQRISGYDVSQTLTLGETLHDTITTQQPLVLYGFHGLAGQTVDVSMTRDSGNLDPFLIVVDADGREIARNDDVTLSSTNAVIRGLTIPADGDYLIAASRYGQRFGDSVGDYTLWLSANNTASEPGGTFALPTTYGELQEGTITNARYEYIYVFDAEAGDLVSAQASAMSGNLDTSLVLTDPLGNTVARNDDDVTNASTDAALRQVLIPADGAYSLIVTRFQGPNGNTAGDFRLKLTLEQRDADEGGRLRYAVLNPLASGTIREDGTLYTDYFVGDQVDDENEERRYHVLLTFALPDAPEDAEIALAEFLPEACSFRGDGLNSSALVVYAEAFGVVEGTAAMAAVGADAVELGRLRTCNPLDITEAVETAYRRGMQNLQLRLVLPDAPQNRETDAVGLSEPRVSVLFAEAAE